MTNDGLAHSQSNPKPSAESAHASSAAVAPSISPPAAATGNAANGAVTSTAGIG